jgi:hypothetical protein
MNGRFIWNSEKNSVSCASIEFPFLLFLGKSSSVKTEVFALVSADELSSSRVADWVVSSLQVVTIEALHFGFLPPNIDRDHPMTEVFAASEGDT